jgi:hypothetical protein
LRKTGFEQAGIVDPTLYFGVWNWLSEVWRGLF